MRGVESSKGPFEPGHPYCKLQWQYLRVGAIGVIVRLCSALFGTRRRILGSHLQSIHKRKQETDNVFSQHVRFLVARRTGYKFLRGRETGAAELLKPYRTCAV